MIDQLPVTWITITLNDISYVVRGITFPAFAKEEIHTPNNVCCLRTSNIQREIEWDDVYFIDRKYVKRDDQFVQTGDVLMSMANSYALVGKVAIASNVPSPTAFGAFLAAIRPTLIVDGKYLFHLLRTNRIQSELREGSTQTTNIANISVSRLSGIEIPLAPLNEQKRIADKLDAVLARVDACRDRLDRIPTILKRFRLSVLAAAVTGVLTEEWRQLNPHLIDAEQLANSVHFEHEESGGHKSGNAAAPTEDVHDVSIDMFPSGWQILTLRDAVKPNRPITYGILKPGPELEKGVPYIRVADFPGEKLNLSTIRNTSPKIDENFKRSRLLPGDLLLSIRGTVGRIIEIPAELENANITQDTARLTIQPNINRLYVLWFLRSSIAQDRMKKATKGVAVRGINIGDVRALQLPLPSRSEQDEIVRRLESLFAYADRLEARYKIARTQVEKLTPSLLAKAFRGKLVPQDPTDEPASELLARIAASKSAEQPKTHAGKRQPKPA